MTNLWSAPYRGLVPVDARITIPGSKSVTNRALILAALSDSPTLMRKPLHSRDSALMIGGLKALGVGIAEAENGDLTITPAPLFGPAHIDVGNAGTVMRFLPPVAAMAKGILHFDGDPRSHERPLGPVIAALESLGVSIEHGGRYSLPLTMNSNGQLQGGSVDVDASSSSQFISALLLVAPATKDGITIRHTGTSLPSMPHIDMTVHMLRELGVEIEIIDNKEWRVSPSVLHGREITIEPDLSNAAPFMGAAMICGGSVTITDWPQSTTQPGDQLRSILTDMGASVSFEKSSTGFDLKLTSDGKIHGIDVDLHDVGELTPSIAALAVLADSPSSLRGIGHLRLHETDRLAAIANEVNALGGAVVEEESALHITPAPLHGGTFHTYEDHRLATAGAMIGLRIPGIEVENIATTQKTLPDFPGAWADLLSQVHSK
ncbi:MAG: 3-phosphoshikimate 1-carboxyvinyltransferase [Actinomycetes bacterium]